METTEPDPIKHYGTVMHESKMNKLQEITGIKEKISALSLAVDFTIEHYGALRPEKKLNEFKKGRKDKDKDKEQKETTEGKKE